MATLLLQAAGSSIGGLVGGPFGAVVGRAIGGIAGYAIDNPKNAKDIIIDGPRLTGTSYLTSNEGATIPEVFGQVRVGGEIIWATRFQEVISTSTSSGGGGKGSRSAPTTTTQTYSYYCSFAVGLCRGKIAGIRRIWADGKELDQTTVDYRLYHGSDLQEPDPLIEAKQGAGNAPAYRGTAYIVFESLALKSYGNRIPQITVEVLKPVDPLGSQIKSIAVIPGATEFGYHPLNVDKTSTNGVVGTGNRHNSIAVSDWAASIDELMLLCPNLETVSLVISWFGTDLRSGECQVRPGVEFASKPSTASSWIVSGAQASPGLEVSREEGRPVYGGTPSDSSILAAIADLKSRGLKVVLNPFILMDIPKENALDDPYGNGEQSHYPWRGRITCHPAIGQPNSVDQTANSVGQIDQFCGLAEAGNFTLSTDTVQYLGPAEWSFRRQILHYAHLSVLAGGVDGLLIGSELKGLTSVRDDQNAFPFVQRLQNLATEIKAIVGPLCKLTYGADWSEYFGYHPNDGSNDVYFNLDPLWADQSIDHVGIDNYMPISDIRDESKANVKEAISVASLKSQVNSGEGYDWFYANPTDRLGRNRTEITDGLNEPWVWRYKDLVSWWQNQHFNRVGGVRESQPTQWIPQSKPLVFTELGCPAIDKGSNQPNVFVDPKSSESDLPYFSSGSRDDLVQSRFLKAHYEHWSPSSSTFDDLNNPISSVYAGRMVDASDITVWTWDARPFPWFPSLGGAWGDGENWHYGHWLNGRLAGCPLDSLITNILEQNEETEFSCDVDGFVDGVIIADAQSARSSLEDLISFFDVIVSENGGGLQFASISNAKRFLIDGGDLVLDADAPKTVHVRSYEIELPREAKVSHGTIAGNYEETSTKTRRLEGGSDRQVTMSLPAIIPATTAAAVAENKIRTMWIAQNKLNIALPRRFSKLSAGDVFSLADQSGMKWLVEEVDTAEYHRVSARQVEDFPTHAYSSSLETNLVEEVVETGVPEVLLLDLPNLNSDEDRSVVTHLAVLAAPWAGEYAAFTSPTEFSYDLRGTTQVPASIGELASSFAEGPIGRWDEQNTLFVKLYTGQFSSLDAALILNGANALAVQCNDGGWEVLQYSNADLQSDGSWKLNKFLRGQFGSEDHMLSGASLGNKVVLLDQALTSIFMENFEVGLELNWRVGSVEEPYSSENYWAMPFTNDRQRLIPFKPVHLELRADPGGHILHWFRQSRVDFDSWENPVVPLGETSEKYLVSIGDWLGNTLMTREVFSPQMQYTAADHLELFGSSQADVKFSVSQIAEGGMLGKPNSLSVQL